MLFDDAPVPGGGIPAVARFLNSKGSSGTQKDAGERFGFNSAGRVDFGGEFADVLEGCLVASFGGIGEDRAGEGFDDFVEAPVFTFGE